MVEQLAFHLVLRRGPDFTLDAEQALPLSGVTAISGPSGSGKTTLLRALAGLETKTGELRSIRFGNTVWESNDVFVPPEDRRIGFVFQEPALFPHLDVVGNLRYGAKRRSMSDLSAILRALDLQNLLSRPVQSLSGGEARRVALGRALASNPQVLFLDEPMSGLDAARKSDFLPYLARAVSQARVPALYVTHSQEEIATLADRVLTMQAGRILENDAPPMRLTGKAEGLADQGITVRLSADGPNSDPAKILLQTRALPGETIGLGLLPENMLISREHPGDSGALAVLNGDLSMSTEWPGHRELGLLGQRLILPLGMSCPDGLGPVHVSILGVFPRPELDDSA